MSGFAGLIFLSIPGLQIFNVLSLPGNCALCAMSAVCDVCLEMATFF